MPVTDREKYRNPSPPEDVKIEDLTVKVTEKPTKYTIVDGTKCRLYHLIHPSFFVCLPKEEELDKLLISSSDDSSDAETITDTQAAGQSENEKISTCQKQDKDLSLNVDQLSKDFENVPMLGKKQVTSKKKSPKKIKTERISDSDSHSESEVRVLGKKEVASKKKSPKKIKTERISDSDSYNESEDDTSRARKPGKSITAGHQEHNSRDKRKKKYHPIKIKREKYSDEHSSEDDRASYKYNSRKSIKIEDRYNSRKDIKSERPEARYSDEDWDDSSWYPDSGGASVGLFYCKDCHSSMNSLATYQTHLRGKRHIKNTKSQIPSELALQSVQSIEGNTRCPPVTQNCRRVNINEKSILQGIADSIEEPCPGLKHVFEIQLPNTKECIYYCGICNSPCSASSILPHLKGFKHRLHCLKIYDPVRYEQYRYSKKSEIDRKVFKSLKEFERQHGRGKITVQRDIDIYQADPSMQAGPSWRQPPPDGGRYMPENLGLRSSVGDIEPDTSKSDYYCPTCDAHMNNKSMWEAHVRGKRHQKNMKKAPGEFPSKTKYIKCSSTSKLELNLSDVTDVIVGLDFIRETQGEAGEMYNCFLCGACCTSYDIIDHLILPKHRLKYLERVNAPEVQTAQDVELGQNFRNQLLEDIARTYENQFGRGKVEVYVKPVVSFGKY